MNTIYRKLGRNSQEVVVLAIAGTNSASAVKSYYASSPYGSITNEFPMIGTDGGGATVMRAHGFGRSNGLLVINPDYTYEKHDSKDISTYNYLRRKGVADTTPYIYITSPHFSHGGGTIGTGKELDLTWETQGVSGTVSIYECYYSTSSYPNVWPMTLIESAVENSGTFRVRTAAESGKFVKYAVRSDDNPEVWDWNRSYLTTDVNTALTHNMVADSKEVRPLIKSGQITLHCQPGGEYGIALYTMQGKLLYGLQQFIGTGENGITLPGFASAEQWGILTISGKTETSIFKVRIE